MKIYLIRHGMTAGNREKRYVGCHTDEDLCEEGIAQIQSNEYPRVRPSVCQSFKKMHNNSRINISPYAHGY